MKNPMLRQANRKATGDPVIAGLVRAGRLAKGFSQGELARLCNTTVPTISGIETAASAPSATMLRRIAEALDLAFLEPKAPALSGRVIRMAFIPGAAIAAGGPTTNVLAHAHESVGVPVEFCPEPEFCRAVIVQGRSMEPRIPDGAAVVLDVRQAQPEALQGAIVAANVPDVGIVAKTLLLRGRRLVLRSVNRSFGDYLIPTRLAPKVILGRVIAVRLADGNWRKIP